MGAAQTLALARQRLPRERASLTRAVAVEYMQGLALLHCQVLPCLLALEDGQGPYVYAMADS